MYYQPSDQQPPQQLPWPHLLGLLVEHRRHGEDGAALIQRGREALPLLVQLGGNLLDLLRGIMTGLREAGSHRHDAVDVDIGILGSRGEGALSGASWNNTHRACLGVGEYLGKGAAQRVGERLVQATLAYPFLAQGKSVCNMKFQLTGGTVTELFPSGDQPNFCVNY